MAIYQPPKQSAAGGVMSGVGSGMMAVGGTMAMAGVAAGGVGAIPGLAVAGVGALLNVAGTIVDGSGKKKAADYEANYANQVQGEQNLQTSYMNNLNQSKANYNQQGVNQSLKAINNMISPSSNVPSNGGTGLSNNRLI